MHRAETLSRAQVWRTPSVPVGEADLRGPTDAPRQLSCRFIVSDLGGTTPKFDCVLDTGERIRIKYGNGPEIPAEAAATRLLNALGFGADQIALLTMVRCYGCPEEPFSMMKAVEVTHAESLYKRIVDFDHYEDFEWVALERKFDARAVESDEQQGWAFYELKNIDAARGGAPLEHVDALRLLAVLLAHWDNKAENQRMVCLSDKWPQDTSCPEPFLLLQDVGATFGPLKVDLNAWERTRIWDDRRRCLVAMRDLPYEGMTFGDAEMSERGRTFLSRLLAELSDTQLTALFSSARFDQKRGVFTTTSPVSEWVRVFRAKVQAISEGPACPRP